NPTAVGPAIRSSSPVLVPAPQQLGLEVDRRRLQVVVVHRSSSVVAPARSSAHKSRTCPAPTQIQVRSVAANNKKTTIGVLGSAKRPGVSKPARLCLCALSNCSLGVRVIVSVCVHCVHSFQCHHSASDSREAAFQSIAPVEEINGDLKPVPARHGFTDEQKGKVHGPYSTHAHTRSRSHAARQQRRLPKVAEVSGPRWFFRTERGKRNRTTDNQPGQRTSKQCVYRAPSGVS
uniref:Uncharacterized protein n=1 Tax=Anopheles dirus TaxID=7168 RepID=A0A182MZW8_9DIPT